MPRISYFYGIAIYMYHRDNAPPHFHAIDGEQEAVIRVDSGDIERGQLPTRAKSFVTDWATMHRDELLRNWELAQAGEPLIQIPPLD